MIFDMLDTTIRKVDRVGAIYNTSTIIGLSLVEGSTRVVISNSVGVSVGRWLSKVRLGISTNSVSNNWGMGVQIRGVQRLFSLKHTLQNLTSLYKSCTIEGI